MKFPKFFDKTHQKRSPETLTIRSWYWFRKNFWFFQFFNFFTIKNRSKTNSKNVDLKSKKWIIKRIFIIFIFWVFCLFLVIYSFSFNNFDIFELEIKFPIEWHPYCLFIQNQSKWNSSFLKIQFFIFSISFCKFHIFQLFFNFYYF